MKTHTHIHTHKTITIPLLHNQNKNKLAFSINTHTHTHESNISNQPNKTHTHTHIYIYIFFHTQFTLTFFLNQSYALWRKCYALSRRLQGRLHDINMSLAAHASRKPKTTTTTTAPIQAVAVGGTSSTTTTTAAAAHYADATIASSSSSSSAPPGTSHNTLLATTANAAVDGGGGGGGLGGSSHVGTIIKGGGTTTTTTTTTPQPHVISHASGGTVPGGSTSSTSTTGSTLSSSSTTAAATAASPQVAAASVSGSIPTVASRQLLELIGRYGRLFNLLTYASFTRSHRPILTPAGMRRLVDRGLLTAYEREVLLSAELPATQRHNAVLMWIARSFIEGMQAGHFVGGPGFENQILEKLHVCRAQYGAIGDELSGRMPLAYAHIVQVLVDVVLWMYPIMAISSNMSPILAILGTGILTITYQGLFDLAKQFLDPYDNESFGKGEDPLVVDTLIAETNAASIRWMNALSEFPIAPQKIRDGTLSEYLLPVRGYSVPELEQLESQRLERERERQERLQKEEEERRMAEEKSRKVRKAAQAMVPALYNDQDYQLDLLRDKYNVQWESRKQAVTGSIMPPHATITNDGGDTKKSHLAARTPRARLLSLEGRLPTLAYNGGYSFPVGEGISHIVTHLDDIAGGVPNALVPDGTTAAKQEH